ncbi:MAG: hypothetical protein CSB13_09800 [Chloroflexi bacterium]|nr:MAG: hypothetical protein CSB13_09800 [Chloroflexota bacterium]
MEQFVLAIHNILRWPVLILGLLAVLKAFNGWSSKKEWQGLDNKLGLGFTISLDVQVLLGFLLYFVFSGITKTAFSDIGTALGNPSLRFFLFEHLLIMIAASAFAHIGRSRAKKADTDVNKHKSTAIFFAIAMLLILAGIPWDRVLLPF